jgi:hypothetical protein
MLGNGKVHMCQLINLYLAESPKLVDEPARRCCRRRRETRGSRTSMA